jgi:hypothetical protein
LIFIGYPGCSENVANNIEIGIFLQSAYGHSCRCMSTIHISSAA